MPTPEKAQPWPGWLVWVAMIGLGVLFASGIVLALADVVDVPGPVVEVALLVALAAAIVVVGWTWAESRRRGLGLIRSLGRSLRAFGRFVVDFL